MKNTTIEMYEEQEIVLRKKAVKLKTNHDKIPKEERTGTGKYTKAYNAFREEVMTETVKYACMGIRVSCILDEELLQNTNEIVKENFKEILKLVFRCQFDELNILLEQLHRNFMETYYLPQLFQQSN